jgi:glycosyltransferase involved in cell wall biosynthesis
VVSPAVRGIIFTESDSDRLLIGRTERSLRAAGIVQIVAVGVEQLPGILDQAGEPVWLLRAGSWQPNPTPFRTIPASATGRELIGMGYGGPSYYLSPSAARALAGRLRTGESVERATQKLSRKRQFRAVPLHDIDVSFDSTPRVLQVVTSIQMGGAERVAIDLAHEFNRTGWRTALVAIGSPTRRAYPAPPWFIDLSSAGIAPENRADAVHRTALNFGGDVIHAHLISADEAKAIRARGLPLAITIHNALPIWPEGCAEARAPFADLLIGCAEAVTREIEERLSLSRHRERSEGGKEGGKEGEAESNDPVERCAVLTADAANGTEMCGGASLTRFGGAFAFPLRVRHAPPHAVMDVIPEQTPRSALVSQDDLRCAIRTVWNGVDASRTEPTPERVQAGLALREQLGWGATDFVVLNVANPRPQKRLDRLPEIVARLADLIAPRRVRLLLAGEPATHNADARECLVAFDREIDRWDVRATMHWAGAADDVAPLLAAADVLLAVSSHEGLSLAQLEALAAGLPVVATDVGGTREVAARSKRFALLPAAAAAEAFALTLTAIAQNPPPRVSALPPDFGRDAMARRTRLCLHSLLSSRARNAGSECVWLVTNNFTTGGAQSSARRLLAGLQRRGHTVRAATLEEWIDRQSHGSTALRGAGVPVTNIQPNRDAGAMVTGLLEAMVAHPPRAVLLWNVMPPVKILLADLLTMWRRGAGAPVPIFDVSPGEMLFQSLERFLHAKPAGWPLSSARDYGRHLAGAVVKYAGETERAQSTLGAPVHVIRNGIPHGDPVGRKSGRTLVIGTVARLSPDKRLDQLIEAFRFALPRLPKCRLRIAGGPDGDDKTHLAELRKLARGLPVEWWGEARDIPRFLRELDLFAMISEPAGCPNASLEAMAAGLPIVATDHGGAREQVIDRVTGRLVPRGDTAAFAEALVELAADPQLRQRLAEGAHAHVRREFSMERMTESYAALIFGERDEERGCAFGSADLPEGAIVQRPEFASI